MIAAFLKKPWASNAIIMVVVSLFLYVLTPYIHWGNNTPFSSSAVRLSMILGLFLALGIKHLITAVMNNHQTLIPGAIDRLKQCRESIRNTKNQLKEKYTSGQLNWREVSDNSKQKRRMKKLPWFVLLGPEQSGKKQLMAKSSIRFVNAKQFGKGAEQYQTLFPDYDWWLSHEGVFVNCNSANAETDALSLKRFIRYLRKNRRRKPINGIIITYSIKDLLLVPNEVRQEHIAMISNKINSLHRGLHSELPVYLTLTGCDLVAGFSEFFNDLSQEELSQIWGMTLCSSQANNTVSVLDQVTEEFNNLILRLQQRVLWALDTDKQLKGRELIFTFPQQMQLFKKPITTFISELLNGTRENKTCQIRGVYFTSAMQGEQPVDFLKAAIGKQFKLTHQLTSPSNPREESYFMSQLFYNVILKEATVLGDSNRTLRLKKWLYKGSLITLPVAIVGGIYAMSHGYNEEKRLLTSLQAQANAFTSRMNQLQPDDNRFNSILPPLNALQHSVSLAGQTSWTTRLLLSHYELQTVTHNAMKRELNVLLLPRVASHLEDQLLAAQSDNTNVLYALLKGYLAFSPSNYTRSTAVIAPMQYRWSQQYHDSPDFHQQLSHYLFISTRDRLPQLPLNRPLINKVRLKLQQIIPSDRAYGLLTFKAAASDIPSIDFSNVIGSDFNHVFVQDKKDNYLPALYTLNGFEKIVLNQENTISTQVSNDNKEIGLTETTTQSTQDIKSQLAKQYTQLYTSSWQQAIKHVKIKKVTTLSGAISLLKNLNNSRSPLKRLLDLIDLNTNQIKKGQVNVAVAFRHINNYTDNITKQINYSNTEKSIIGLQKMLTAISISPDKDKACYEETLKIIKGNPNNPLVSFGLLTKTAPQPVKRWMESINSQVWNILTARAKHYLNDIWNTKIVSVYNDTVAHHYPVYRLSSSDMSIQNFNHFFGPKGVLQAFFNQYLSHYINTNKKNWELYQSNQLSFPLSRTMINALQSANVITQRYFTNGSSPSVTVTLRPFTLSDNITKINFRTADRGFDYAHGPRVPVVIHWPSASDQLTTSITMTDFAHQHYSLHETGTWSLFKILNHPGFRIYNSHQRTILNVSLHHHNASYEINSSIPLLDLKLERLSHFRLPHQL